MHNNSQGSNRVVLHTEHNQTNVNNKNDINNINNKIFKINLGNKNNIKLLNSKINLSKQKTRKLAINFKDAINKKITTMRTNNFATKDINNSKRYKSMNPKDYIINNNSKQKNIIKNNENKSKNHNNNYALKNKNIENKNNLFQKILKESNNLNFKNVASIKSKLPKLKINKTGLNIK